MALHDSIFNERQQHLIRDYQVRYAMREKDHELALHQERSRQNRLYVIVLSTQRPLRLPMRWNPR